jgi:hypothetical protein
MAHILCFGLRSTAGDGITTVTATQCRDSPHMPGCSAPATAADAGTVASHGSPQESVVTEYSVGPDIRTGWASRRQPLSQ